MFLQGPQLAPVVKSLPEIIKQASQSQLGILALLIIVLFGLAIYFFRQAPIKWRAITFFVFFGGVVIYAGEIIRVASKPEAMHYVGHVLDQVTGAPIHEAHVVSMANKPSPPYYTDSGGQFSFWLMRRKASEDARLRIEHAKYQEYDRIVPSDVSSQLGDIPLAPLVASTTPPEPAPGGGTSQPTPAPASPSSSGRLRARAISPSVLAKVGTPAAPLSATLGARVHSATLPSTAMSVAARMPQVVEISSGPRLSGKGKDWSPWYRVRVGTAPAGYTMEKAEFWLTGDRSCGAWAECKEITKNDTEVVWDFCLQGHDEWGAPPQAYSEGHLRVIYKLK